MSQHELLEKWRFRAHRMQIAHYDCAKMYDRYHLWLGLPTIIFSAIVSTSIFATLSKDTDFSIQIIIGVLSITAAILASLQTFLKYSDLSEKHRVAGSKFANLKHKIELIIEYPPEEKSELKKNMTEIENEWSQLRGDSPNVPNKIWKIVSNEVVNLSSS